MIHAHLIGSALKSPLVMGSGCIIYKQYNRALTVDKVQYEYFGIYPRPKIDFSDNVTLLRYATEEHASNKGASG